MRRLHGRLGEGGQGQGLAHEVKRAEEARVEHRLAVGARVSKP